MAIHLNPPLKRTASQAQFDGPVAKKQYIGAIQHHKAVWDPQRDYRRNAQSQDAKAAENLLSRALKLALEAVGFGGAEAGALESFRMAVEEYMAHFLSDVRFCMASCRRIRAIPEDFLQALHTHQLSLRSLLPHLNPPLPPARTQVTLENVVSDPSQERTFRSTDSLFAEARPTQSYIPKHFPHFPDRHTYQTTSNFPQRDDDAQKLRERAAEESRLGEQALRKLVKAGTAASFTRTQNNENSLTLREQRHNLWLETISAVSLGQSKGIDGAGEAMQIDKGKGIEIAEDRLSALYGQLSTAVNSEAKYWRKPPRRGGS